MFSLIYNFVYSGSWQTGVYSRLLFSILCWRAIQNELKMWTHSSQPKEKHQLWISGTQASKFNLSNYFVKYEFVFVPCQVDGSIYQWINLSCWNKPCNVSPDLNFNQSMINWSFSSMSYLDHGTVRSVQDSSVTICVRPSAASLSGASFGHRFTLEHT